MKSCKRSMHKHRIDGVQVVVTRPENHAQNLIHAIEAQGGRAICYPTLVIEPIGSQHQIQQANAMISASDIVIPISRNAIEYTHQLLDQSLFTNRTIAVVGQGSADCFEALFHRPVNIVPASQFDSEGLLATPELQSQQIKGKTITIIRGEGGRAHLAEQLRDRGAKVDYLELYRRVIPSGSDRHPDPDWNSGKIDAVITTSNAVLEHLFLMTPISQRDALLQTTQIVVSQRARKLAAELGFIYDAVVADNATTDILIDTLIQWHQQRT